MTNDALLNVVCPGHPLQIVETGEDVYFRSARFSPHAGEVLAIVADEAGGVMAVSAEEVDFRHYEDGTPCVCRLCAGEVR
jgi:hypothetical protein